MATFSMVQTIDTPKPVKRTSARGNAEREALLSFLRSIKPGYSAKITLDDTESQSGMASRVSSVSRKYGIKIAKDGAYATGGEKRGEGKSARYYGGVFTVKIEGIS